MLVAKQLTKIHGKGEKLVRALDGVSLAAKEKEFLIIQGPSGSGKTTLLLVLGGLLTPNAGHLELVGCDPFRLSASRRALFRTERIGFVFQQFYLIPFLSVRDNIASASLGKSCPQAQQRTTELLEQFQLTARGRHFPAELSTGEKQRTALARALFHRPALLLADEPTGNLDEENSLIVLAAFKEFASNGSLVIMVTHDPRWESYATRVERMAAGRLSSAGQT